MGAMVRALRPEVPLWQRMPEAIERRTASRFRTIFRVAQVTRAHDVGLWRVRNISDEGMMLLTSVPVQVGEKLSLTLSDQVTLAATVCWWDGERCGVVFDEPIDCAGLLLALAACGRSGGEAERQAASGNVSVSGAPADITISTANGTAEIRTGGAIAALPEGIPAYPNADAGQNIDINGGSARGQGRILGFSTHDTPAQVIAFYAQAVAAAGYTIPNRMDMGATSSLTARRGEGQVVNIVAVQAGASTRVQIIVAAGGA